MIDLHTHTTASDGRCTPAELVTRASGAGVTTLSVTDHDTVAGYAAASLACAEQGLQLVPGVEITAVHEERDVHLLAYFIDVASESLLVFLGEQRRRRIDRVRQIVTRLAALGMPLDADAILQPGLNNTALAVGRPWIARALMSAGHVASVSEAFDKWLSRGCPAFVPRTGAPPEEVVARVHDAGGIASLAHPVLVGRDDLIPGFASAGLDAIEAFHSDHDEKDTARYLAIASKLDLLVTGGSDFHADGEHGGGGPGSVTLPRPYFERLLERTSRPRG